MDEGFTGNDSTSIANSGSSTSSNRDVYLNQLNKNSYKIAKPIRKPLPPPPPAASSSTVAVLDPNPQDIGQTQAQSQQPPVYNINKNDFRDVVQKLTGAPAHERFSTPPPPPASHPRPPSSRLQRFRPPPLAQITNRPPQLTPVVPRLQYDGGQRALAFSGQPFTPLPPLPSVHPAAESPISAYMKFWQSSAPSAPPPPNPDSQQQPQNDVAAYLRFIQNSIYAPSASSPKWNGVAQPPPPQPPVLPSQQQQPTLQFPVMPLSPLPFGCAPSPRSQYGMLSPSLLLSPTGQFGLPQLPLSPTLPLQSPRWKAM